MSVVFSSTGRGDFCLQLAPLHISCGRCLLASFFQPSEEALLRSVSLLTRNAFLWLFCVRNVSFSQLIYERGLFPFFLRSSHENPFLLYRMQIFAFTTSKEVTCGVMEHQLLTSKKSFCTAEQLEKEPVLMDTDTGAGKATWRCFLTSNRVFML